MVEKIVIGLFDWLGDKGWPGFFTGLLLLAVIVLLLEIRRLNEKRLIEARQNLMALAASTTAIENSTNAINGVRAVLGAIAGPQVTIQVPAKRKPKKPVRRQRRRA